MIVKDVLAEAMDLAPAGRFVEFGVGTGTSLRRLNKARPGAIGFDSFQGLPEDWRPEYPRGTFACEPPEIPGAQLVIGEYGPETLTVVAPCALLHVDCDLYSSTCWALEWFKLNAVPGAILVFDEFFGYKGCEEHEEKALDESGLKVEELFRSDAASQKVAFRVLP